jgi:hypothetical protein
MVVSAVRSLVLQTVFLTGPRRFLGPLMRFVRGGGDFEHAAGSMMRLGSIGSDRTGRPLLSPGLGA